jgi:uncharacterized protein YheU (UPF0270 family)
MRIRAPEGSPSIGEQQEPIEVPASELSRGVLRALVEEFVTRDGTDYGAVEQTLESKVAAVLRQLERGEVRIVFDPESETTTLVSRP